MVYCRAPSKGCERCRQRKVKCDEGRPGCLKCAKLKQNCPGYRNLDEVRIRDESERVAHRHRQEDNSSEVWIPQQPLAQSLWHTTPAGCFATSPQASMTIEYPLSPSSHALGANFFFAKYSPNDGSSFRNYHAWLIQSYSEQGPNNVLRKAIEAVGMAGLSNVFYAPNVKSQARAQYFAALVSMQQALNDPAQAVSDATFMALMLLAFFETVDCNNPGRYPHWAAHVKAGTAVLELRGQNQFDSERGGLLYVQFRSYLLLACMQENLAVPKALVKATFSFQTGALRQNWQRANIASPGSITEICIRVANLCAVLKGQEVTNPQAIRAIALEIDTDLETWRAGLPPSWAYATIQVRDAANDTFSGKKHVYNNLWNAEAWNYWRTLRALVTQLMLENEARSTEPDDALMTRALSTLRQLCIEICISTYSFRDSPRKSPSVPLDVCL
ncbi:hypothetical protein AYL99_09531 [Fonsecaea erecta]|uniref:Zn(2)-C6 fungal-type domain-containing protein n=1 Tax=Fonsecaea erecta TaxID=1367422 RepID=A0A178Z9K3_9EURO|nr:hypothetical protein AYL99_09531 [Fonsecaea erecta]OAP56352.1 hypothetical protein AYL99_09531 [Fonsecaea erecta]